MTAAPLRIAVLTPTAGPALAVDEGGALGGAEQQLAALGRTLSARGHAVDFIVAGEGEPPIATPAGTVWPRYPLRGLPLLKLAHPKATALLRLLRERRSQVLLQRGAAELTGLAAACARMRGIPFVFMVASDLDLDPGRELMPHPQDRLLYAAGLRAARCIVAQTRDQARRLRRLAGRRAVVMPSFPAAVAGPPAEEPSSEPAVLWGGNLRPVKRPEWLIELARRFPAERFIAFGGPVAGQEGYGARIAEALRALPNLEYLGRVPPGELDAVFQRAGVFLNTSREEGFPNTFLLAWRHGLSVAASVDPDGLLSEGGLGVHAPDLPALSGALAALLGEDRDARSRRQRRVKAYLLAQHDAERLGEAWESLLRGLVASGGLRKPEESE